MRCPYCGFMEDRVVDSRMAQEGRAVRRRRECIECKQRYTTYEYIEKIELIVVKNDERREPYNREKLLTGIRLACKKRPIPGTRIESLVGEIENELYERARGGEVSAKILGELVMEKLRELDEVAYVRFASVYRKFEDRRAFEEALKRLPGG
jgi:transcriptional repressor NrdR